MESVRRAAEMVIEEVRKEPFCLLVPVRAPPTGRPGTRQVSWLTRLSSFSPKMDAGVGLVPAPVPQPAMELLHHPTWGQRVRESYDPR